VPYDELTGRPKPLVDGLPLQMTSALVSVVLILHEFGALYGRDVIASTQFAAVDAYLTGRLRPGLDAKHDPTGESELISVFRPTHILLRVLSHLRCALARVRNGLRRFLISW
jgi:hypothetical protein